MKKIILRVWRGEISFVYLFWMLGVAVSIITIFFMQYLSMTLSMHFKNTIGLAVGVLFLIYNFIVTIGIFQGSRKSSISLTLKIMSRLVAFFLFLISLWMAIYFSGRGLPVIFENFEINSASHNHSIT